LGIFKVLLGGIFEAEDDVEAVQKARDPENVTTLTTLRVFELPNGHYDPQLELAKADIDKLIFLDDDVLENIDPSPEAMKIWRKNKERPSMILEAKLKNRDDLVAIIYITEVFNSTEIITKVINVRPELVQNEINWLIKKEYEQK